MNRTWPGASDLCCPKEAVPMTTPHSAGARPIAGDGEFLQVQKERGKFSVPLEMITLQPHLEKKCVKVLLETLFITADVMFCVSQKEQHK